MNEPLKHYAICLGITIGLALACWIVTGGNPESWGVMVWGVTK